MTGLDVINRADEFAPNQYSVEQKLDWLSDFDAKVWHELLYAYIDAGEPPEPYADGSETLLIPAPYGRDVYVYFLLAKAAEMNAEIAKYNLYAAQYNSAYGQYCAWYNRTHERPPARNWRF